ncbi:hypothetical protein D9758_017210 [Tetrapyrgos nigripes]|uniref:F-box domain-containing protein n=1 Tax=Tetrapyrgos nigripes TaxID=182062 RepID=A0A8H5C2R2_9AGAR|nr:hypothetical protein D9758_017210 [Tetrapyrgos nigripes]
MDKPQARAAGSQSSSPTFPQEIFDQIIDWVAIAQDTIPTLKTCTLVCQAWLDYGRTHLFREMKFPLEFPKTGTEYISSHIRSPIVREQWKERVAVERSVRALKNLVMMMDSAMSESKTSLKPWSLYTRRLTISGYFPSTLLIENEMLNLLSLTFTSLEFLEIRHTNTTPKPMAERPLAGTDSDNTNTSANVNANATKSTVSLFFGLLERNSSTLQSLVLQDVIFASVFYLVECLSILMKADNATLHSLSLREVIFDSTNDGSTGTKLDGFLSNQSTFRCGNTTGLRTLNLDGASDEGSRMQRYTLLPAFFGHSKSLFDISCLRNLSMHLSREDDITTLHDILSYDHCQITHVQLKFARIYGIAALQPNHIPAFNYLESLTHLQIMFAGFYGDRDIQLLQSILQNLESLFTNLHFLSIAFTPTALTSPPWKIKMDVRRLFQKPDLKELLSGVDSCLARALPVKTRKGPGLEKVEILLSRRFKPEVEDIELVKGCLPKCSELQQLKVCFTEMVDSFWFQVAAYQ